MIKHRLIWLGMALLSLATLLVMGGCGGSSSSKDSSVGKAAISGTVSFPNLGSLVGKRVAKSVGLGIPRTYTTPTVELRDLNGNLIATAVATASGTDYSYTFNNVDFDKDYVVKAYTANNTNVIKAIVDKNSLFTATNRNIDTISTAAVIVTEQNLGATPGSIGEKATTAAEITNAAKFSTTAIATFNPLALESKIYTAIGTVNNAPGTATQLNVDLVNLVNVVAASVYNDVNPSSLIAGTATLPVGTTTTQYTISNATAVGNAAAPIVQAEIVATITSSVTLYTPPPATSVTFTSRVMDYSSTIAVAVKDVAVTANGLTTYTDAGGYYTLAGITKGTDFYVKMSKAGYADSYSALLNISANSNSSSRPYALYLTTALTAWGNTTGNAVISARVVDSTNLETGYIGGVVVTATATVTATGALDSAGYTAIYSNTTTPTGVLDTSLESTSTNGKWMFMNVPAGRTVTVSASKNGYTFASRTFTTFADSVSQGRITGTAVASTPTTTSALKASLLSGWYEFRSNNSYDQTTGTNTDYYYVERMGLKADGVTMTRAIVSYYDRTSKTWRSTPPAGFPTNNSVDYALSAAGTWVVDDGPEGYTVVFNSDSTATVTSPATGEIITIAFTSDNLSGQTILTTGTDGAPLLSTAGLYPAGSSKYNIAISSTTDSYSLWSNNSQRTSLAAVPAAYAEDGTGSTFSIESPDRTAYFYGKFVAGSTTSVNVYRGIDNSPSPAAFVGTATAATKTVLGQQILEITIPAGLKTTYKLSNTIFAVVGGVVLEGAHYLPGLDANRGGSLLNNVAINHLKASIDTSLAKPAGAKSISKAVLGM